MKSNLNDTDEVIELLAQDVIPVSNNSSHPNTDDNDHVGYITAEIVTETTATTTTTKYPIGTGTTTTKASSTTTTTTTPSCLFYSKYNPVDIPNVARTLSWNDSFYESNDRSNDNVIAVFDIDRTIYDQFPMSLVIVSTILLIGIIFTITFFLVGIFCILFVILPMWLALICKYSDRPTCQFRMKRTHIAITRNGICIDQVDEPDSDIIMVRKVICYTDIEKCEGKTEYNGCSNTMNYKIILHSKKKSDPNQSIEGIARPQQFVDVVNEMIAQGTDPTRTVSTLFEAILSIFTPSRNEIIHKLV